MTQSSVSDPIRFVGYTRQYDRWKDRFNDVFHDVMSHGDFILRKHLADFENRIAAYVGTKHAIGVNTGTDALYLSAHALGFGPGDEVITVSHTFVATVGAVVQCGATPVLIDITDDFNMDVSQIEGAITERTKGIIPVHLNGHSTRMDTVMDIARRNNLSVIEDAAQALGASFKGRRCASFGDTGIFSFYPAKMLGTAGDGGMVCTNDDSIARRIKAFRDNGRFESAEKIECFGWCTRLDNLHAAILNMKFDFFEEGVARRRELACHYNEGLMGVGDLRLPPVSTEEFYDVFQNYVIRTQRRNDLADHLKKRGIETLVSWRVPCHKQRDLGLDKFDLPVTEKIANEVLSLPMYPELTDEEVDRVVSEIKRFFTSCV